MTSLAGETEAAEHLKKTALRDFGPLPEGEDQQSERGYKLRVSRDDVPVPALLKHALTLVGLKAGGPGEKVAWWVTFSYRGEYCELAYEKFGVRLYLRTEAAKDEAGKTMAQIMKKLRSASRTVEKLVLDSAPRLLGQGNATVINQHSSLRQAYEYFRERAVDPAFIEDEMTTREYDDGGTATSFTSGAIRMRMHAFNDLVAAITAYLSLLEHDLVLALAFSGFDPTSDDLTDIIGSRWGEKFDRLLGKDGDAGRYKQQLTDVVERWRNPYSHGGFEKGHSATIYLHAPGIGTLPVGMTRVRDSPLFSLLPASETDITDVFALFDEIDSWLESTFPEASRWIDSGLNVSFDEDFRSRLAEAREADAFDRLLDYFGHQQEMVDNMEF